MPESDLKAFLAAWDTDHKGVKPLFEKMYACLAGLENVELEYKGRPGISHSLRARHKAQKNRPLFVLVDIIDDAPEERWLSVCFYADLVSDPQNSGDLVPGGLMGEDARCFDIDEPDEEVLDRMLAMLCEAHARAALQ